MAVWDPVWDPFGTPVAGILALLVALTCDRKSRMQARMPALLRYTSSMVKITCNNHGPLRIEGEIALCDIEGGIFDLAGRTVISLCRCGASDNKPFCDGSHKKAPFQSEVKARALPPPVPKPPLAQL